MTSGLYNSKYYRGTFLKIQKFMEVREEGMEVQKETVIKVFRGICFRTLYISASICRKKSSFSCFEKYLYKYSKNNFFST